MLSSFKGSLIKNIKEHAEERGVYVGVWGGVGHLWIKVQLFCWRTRVPEARMAMAASIENFQGKVRFRRKQSLIP